MKHMFFIIVTFLVGMASGTAVAASLPGPLVETAWLDKNSKSVLILDVRKDTKSFTGKPEFKTDKKTKKSKLVRVGAHIPGAVLVNYKELRGNQKIGGLTIEKMLIGKEAFEKIMQAAGVNQDSVVVITSKGESNGDMTNATRLYWQMKYYGHDKLAILNGGVAQWIKERRTLSNAPSRPGKGNWKATAERREILATSDEVDAAVKSGKVQLVDTRPLNQYLGTTRKSYVYDKGHIPGAKPYPSELMTEANMGAKFLPVSDVKQLAKAMGVDTEKTSITYCNSGHLATGGWFIMSELVGNKNVKMYDGSMHQWTREKRPVKAMVME